MPAYYGSTRYGSATYGDGSVGDLLAVSDRSATLDIGDPWHIAVRVVDEDGNATSATVTAVVTTPAGATSSATLTESSAGYFETSHLLTEAGRYLAVVTASGAVVGALPFTAWAQAATAAAGMPTLAVVKAYLGTTSASDAVISDALAAEAAAQRARCRVPAAYPDDLAQALKRRVARNLAARAVPIATFTSFEGGGTSARVPQLDAEIQRFEAPYRRRKVG